MSEEDSGLDRIFATALIDLLSTTHSSNEQILHDSQLPSFSSSLETDHCEKKNEADSEVSKQPGKIFSIEGKEEASTTSNEINTGKLEQASKENDSRGKNTRRKGRTRQLNGFERCNFADKRNDGRERKIQTAKCATLGGTSTSYVSRDESCRRGRRQDSKAKRRQSDRHEQAAPKQEVQWRKRPFSVRIHAENDLMMLENAQKDTELVVFEFHSLSAVEEQQITKVLRVTNTTQKSMRLLFRTPQRDQASRSPLRCLRVEEVKFSSDTGELAPGERLQFLF